ncbi:methionyl-tRNA formyltransferase [Variibacter gotjawalensis]|uniref:Methionyl-tRNA formyltransferase n=1 Tax=Variibacter gotjawalensis TaxID=1333996 RepID=A0A0S3PP44_9BRAD|nr:methionyl-tRNA formyltransferase [Variibacter gotjawalensis]NIK47994.1 methionyl-tRNA formyltransferase [Variibacter gotjawalensis]RZS49871.1 methionyl-tRNA formyltransferase [Variibacter gotjawalensis]BAT57700.1 methionyl-tRNA formyltransferase [Variibacter gotjawalensis]
MRVIFMGTPDFAVGTLLEIIGQGHEVVAVYTRAPQPAGRGMDLRPSPVEREARRFGIEVLTPKTLRTEEAAATFASHAADVAVVVAYGMILPKAILDTPPLGCLNLHGSLLPRWRGAAPINRAVMAGDKESGVCAMWMEEGLDTGPVGLAERVAITPDMTAGQLHDALARLGADLMVRALGALARGGLQFTPQPTEGVTYAHKIEKAETRIDWTKSAADVHNHCRGLSPFPGAWFELPSDSGPVRIKALQTTIAHGSGTPGAALDDSLTIACGDGAIRLVTVQRAGKQPMSAADFLRGTAVRAGTTVA